MGFITGFLTGFTLTTTTLYLALQVHRSQRLDQRNAIREQTERITWLALSTGAYDRRLIPKDIPAPVDGRSSGGMQDMLRHRWNEEVRKLARKLYESSWEDVRDGVVEGWEGVKRVVRKG